MTHAEICAALRNDVETHRDVYSNSRRVNDARPAAAGETRVGVLPSSENPSHAARPALTGRDGRGAPPSTLPPGAALCSECGVCVLLPDRDGREWDLVESATCPIHGWSEHPVMRAVPGTDGRRHA